MKELLLKTLENAKEYTLAVTDAMPETGYVFKPKGAGWNFGELLNHIGYGIQWYKSNYLLAKKADWQPPAPKEGKAAILKYLNSTFHDFEETCAGLSLNKDTEIHGFYAALDHITHHRGQAVIYLRCHGITPPEYIY